MLNNLNAIYLSNGQPFPIDSDTVEKILSLDISIKYEQISNLWLSSNVVISADLGLLDRLIPICNSYYDLEYINFRVV